MNRKEFLAAKSRACSARATGGATSLATAQSIAGADSRDVRGRAS